MGRAIFIVVEGPSHLQKETITKLLKQKIDDQTGLDAVILGYPHRTLPDSPLLAHYLQGNEDLPDQISHHLFSARRWYLGHAVQFFLAHGRPVIVQRYVATGHVYTVSQGHFDFEWCKQFDTGLIKPDITIYVERSVALDPEPQIDAPDIYDTPQMRKRIIECFQQMKETEPNWLTIDLSTMNPKQALDHVLPTILGKINDCRENSRDFLHY